MRCFFFVLQTWRYLVLDEGHRVRNMDTLTAKALRSVQRGNVLLLTGGGFGLWLLRWQPKRAYAPSL